MLLTHDSSFSEVRDESNWTLLHFAAFYNSPSCVRVLLRFAPHLVDAVNENNETPLVWAMRWDSRDVVKMLVRAGADVRTEDDDGYTVFDDALDEEMLEILEQHQQVTLHEISSFYTQEVHVSQCF